MRSRRRRYISPAERRARREMLYFVLCFPFMVAWVILFHIALRMGG